MKYKQADIKDSELDRKSEIDRLKTLYMGNGLRAGEELNEVTSGFGGRYGTRTKTGFWARGSPGRVNVLFSSLLFISLFSP